MIKHYIGPLGDFDFDDEEFEVGILEDNETCGTSPYDVAYLHYVGKGTSVSLPKGCINTRFMFQYCMLPAGFRLSDDFDTSEVENMGFMFYNCVMPDGFTLGKNFNTGKVKNMRSMFERCILPEGFSLGEKFDTSNVMDMDGMFAYCCFPEDFVLNEKFVLRCDKAPGENDFPETIEECHNFFSACEMFEKTQLPEGISSDSFMLEASSDIICFNNIVKWLKSRKPVPSSEKPTTISIKKWNQVYGVWRRIADLCTAITGGIVKGEFSFLIPDMMEYAAARITNSGHEITVPIMTYNSRIVPFVLQCSPDDILERAKTPPRFLITEIIWGANYEEKYADAKEGSLGQLTGLESRVAEVNVSVLYEQIHELCKFMTGTPDLPWDEDCIKCITIAFTMILNAHRFPVVPSLQKLEKKYPKSKLTTEPEFKSNLVIMDLFD